MNLTGQSAADVQISAVAGTRDLDACCDLATTGDSRWRAAGRVERVRAERGDRCVIGEDSQVGRELGKFLGQTRPNGDTPGVAVGASITTASTSVTASTFALLPTPPSMNRRPPIVTGGHTTGTAQLAATASTNDTPLSRPNTTRSPVSTSIAVTWSRRSGHRCDGSRCSITQRRTSSATVRADTALLPIARSPSAADIQAWPAACSKSVIESSISMPGVSSCVFCASWRAYSSASGTPLEICAATVEPADVPNSRSALSNRRAASEVHLVRRAENLSPRRFRRSHRRRAPMRVAVPRRPRQAARVPGQAVRQGSESSASSRCAESAFHRDGRIVENHEAVRITCRASERSSPERRSRPAEAT